jgi:hypothetical protein
MTRSRPETKPQRDHHDNQQRHVAALLQRDHPRWVIMYGPWTRLFWAYATLPAPPGHGLVLSAPDPGDLTAQISEAENAAATRAATQMPRHPDQGRHPMTHRTGPPRPGQNQPARLP